MKITAAVTAAVAMLVTGLAIATTTAGASHGNHAIRHFEGKVTSVDAAAQTFTLKDHERGSVTFQVTDSTRFKRLSGFSALTEGLKRVEVKAKRSDGSWVARKVSLSGRRGHHAHQGGSGRSGDDDAGHHQNGDDDSPCHDKGDDHGDDDDNDDHGGHHHGDDDDDGGHHGGSDDS